MNYLKFYQAGGFFDQMLTSDPLFYTNEQKQKFVDMNSMMTDYGLSMAESKELYEAYGGDMNEIKTVLSGSNLSSVTVNPGTEGKDFRSTAADKADAKAAAIDANNRGIGQSPLSSFGKAISGVNFSKNASWRSTGLSDKAAMGMGIGAQLGTRAINAIDEATMGDKNFGAQSQAIDAGTHAVSSALMKSGNPYAIVAGAAIEGVNFLSKAGGQTVQGYDVNIENSGYGSLAHKDSSSSRGGLIFAGMDPEATERKLQRRNEEAQMALKAANVSDEIKFEQEARMNSVDDVIQQNEIALQGGVDTSLLAAKQGGKLMQKTGNNWDSVLKSFMPKQEIVKAQNGAKLEHIEVSDEKSVIPSGAMHKNKNHLDLEDITKKGIPVVTVKDDSAETFEDIKAQESTIQQHAEVEAAEIIFNKELTEYIEEMREKWHEEKDPDICLEAGMRLAKEIVENTQDNTDVTQKSMEAIENEDN